METIKDSPISGTLKGLYMETPHSDLDMTPEQFTDAVANYSFYTYSRANTSFAEGFNDLIARETHYHLEDRGYCFNGIFFKGLSTEDYEKARGTILQAFVNRTIEILERKRRLYNHCLEVNLRRHIKPVKSVETV